MDLFGNKAKARNWVLERELALAYYLLRLEKGKLSLAEAKIIAQKDDILRLLADNQKLASRPIPTRSPEPLYMSEDEEDIRHAKDMGLLSIAEAEDMLRQLDFENENIVIYDESMI